MNYKFFTKRFLYQSEFVVCRMSDCTEGEGRTFVARMDLRKSHYAQRFIESGNKWITLHDEAFFNEGPSKMLPGAISEELLKHLQEHYPITNT